MANNLTDPEENRLLDALHATTTYLAPTAPLKLRLMTANGTDSAGGTQVSGGTYTSQTVAFGSAVNGVVANSALIRYEGLPATTIVGVEVWDSAATPRRLWYSALSSSVAVTANQPFEFAIGSVTFALD